MSGEVSIKIEDADSTSPPGQLRMPEGRPWKERDFFEKTTVPWKHGDHSAQGYEVRNDPTRRAERPFPKAKAGIPPETDAVLARVRKAKSARDPESNVKICSSNYTAMEIHGFYGVIDDGPAANGHMLILHVPKWVRGYQLDVRDGDTLPLAHVTGKTGGTVRVLEVGRHKYYSPGQKVTTCTVCVPAEHWERFKL